MNHEDIILIGDIGGTKADMAVVNRHGDPRAAEKRCILPVRDYDSVESLTADVVRRFAIQPSVVCLGVPGPVGSEVITFTNLPWRICREGLESRLSVGRVILENDIVAAACGIPDLRESEFTTIRHGRYDPSAPKILLAPGTGLGSAALIPQSEGRHLSVPGELGSMPLAPTTIIQGRLHLKRLSDGQRPLVTQDLASGLGITNLWRMIGELIPAVQDSPGRSRLILNAVDPTPEIVEGALDRRANPRSYMAVQEFLSALAAAACTAALGSVARGGIWLGGGLSARLAFLLETPAFISGIRHHDSALAFLQEIPVHVVTTLDLPLLGLARLARLAAETTAPVKEI